MPGIVSSSNPTRAITSSRTKKIISSLTSLLRSQHFRIGAVKLSYNPTPNCIVFEMLRGFRDKSGGMIYKIFSI